MCVWCICICVCVPALMFIDSDTYWRDGMRAHVAMWQIHLEGHVRDSLHTHTHLTYTHTYTHTQNLQQTHTRTHTHAPPYIIVSASYLHLLPLPPTRSSSCRAQWSQTVAGPSLFCSVGRSLPRSVCFRFAAGCVHVLLRFSVYRSVRTYI